jgi:hypothetical protein
VVLPQEEQQPSMQQLEKLGTVAAVRSSGHWQKQKLGQEQQQRQEHQLPAGVAAVGRRGSLVLGEAALDRSSSHRKKQQQSTRAAAAAKAAAVGKSSSCQQEQQRQELWRRWLPLQHQWMPLQQLQLLFAKKQKWLYWRGEQARGHKPLPGEEVLKHQMFCGAQSQPCQSWRSAGCPKKEKRRKKRNAERSWNWIWSPPCQTKSKNVSCPDNKGLLVPSAYQETMIQHILYVFVVVANFYDSHFSICDVLVFQSKKISFASEIWERQVCQPLIL